MRRENPGYVNHDRKRQILYYLGQTVFGPRCRSLGAPLPGELTHDVATDMVVFLAVFGGIRISISGPIVI